MVKLSRRAWNNVIIFSMLILIFLFNTTSNFLNGGADSKPSTYLVPEDAAIASIEFGHVKVERIGQGWRSLGAKATEGELVKLVQTWTEAQIDNSITELSISQASDSRIVFINIVGQPAALKFEVFQVQGKTLILTQQRLHQLRDTPFNSLFIGDKNDA
jgi:hypothetical protein